MKPFANYEERLQKYIIIGKERDLTEEELYEVMKINYNSRKQESSRRWREKNKERLKELRRKYRLTEAGKAAHARGRMKHYYKHHEQEKAKARERAKSANTSERKKQWYFEKKLKHVLNIARDYIL